jgi:glycosyltransferase involved in cell wall biosynthesis
MQLKILIISSGVKKNSGDLSYQMLTQFKKHGHFVKILTHIFNSVDDEVIGYKKLPDNRIDLFRKRLKIILSGIFKRPVVNNRYYFHDIYETIRFVKTDKIIRIIGFRPDIIFLHFNEHFLNPKNLYQLCKRTGAQLFVLLMDMAPMTGGCHYAWDCEGYKHNCGNCPGLVKRGRFDLSYRNLRYRKRYFGRMKVNLVAASNWQFRQAKESALFIDNPVYRILSAYDTEIFKPSDKKSARVKLGIPLHNKTIFFGASIINEERKGIKYLLDAFSNLDEELTKGSLFLLLAGNTTMDFLNSIKIPYRSLGFLEPERLAEAYQAADLFVCPAIEDSGPTMINQAILCGIPVVSFEMGVAPDLVINGQTGYMVPVGDTRGMAEKIDTILRLEDTEYQKMSEKCRNTGLLKCNPEIQAEEYIRLFSETLDSR